MVSVTNRMLCSAPFFFFYQYLMCHDDRMMTQSNYQISHSHSNNLLLEFGKDQSDRK